MADQIAICNQALAEIFSGSISAMDERSAEAVACSRFYAPTLQELLEAEHAWSFAAARADLAVTLNDRPGEWPWAFALPEDCARPRRLLPDFDVAGGNGAPIDPRCGGWPFAGVGWEGGLGHFYAIESGTLYCCFTAATLVYTRRGVTPAQMPALFARAFALELASRIVSPLKKSRELKGDLIKAAEVAKQRAAAADANRQIERDAPFLCAAGAARGGWAGLHGAA